MPRTSWILRLLVPAGLCLALAVGCATHAGVGPAVAWSFFEKPRPEDPWSPKVLGWQSRERQISVPPASVSGRGDEAAQAEGPDGSLRAKYVSYRAERKRELAKDLAHWVQAQAQRHYVPDGAIDHWATLEETLERDGDDCDGLELLAYHFLRDLGFRDDEVYRSIVYRAEDGQHHMVTLWFETPDDPWVLDPTGAMTTGMPRLSQVEGWRPLKVFSESEEFSPRETHPERRIAAAR